MLVRLHRLDIYVPFFLGYGNDSVTLLNHMLDFFRRNRCHTPDSLGPGFIPGPSERPRPAL
jgi:hypothetical protein